MIPLMEYNWDTPAVVIDRALAEANIDAFQAHCDEHNLAVRPHIKTHKLGYFARYQVAAGAVGITCQKIGEAEAMAEAGIEDILLSFNILGSAKLSRLKALAKRLKKLTLVADNATVVAGLAATFTESQQAIDLLVECDTGAQRCGVQNPQQALALAQQIDAAKGLNFAGLMTYPGNNMHAQVSAQLDAVVQTLAQAGLTCQTISSGGTPDLWQAATVAQVTEYRPGTYIYNDRSLVQYGTCDWQQCALRVVATVISTPAPGRAIIDAGSKVLSSDLLGLPDYGYLPGFDRVSLYALSEEHGHLRWPGDEALFEVGQQVQIIPNHACVVSNLVGQVWLHIDGQWQRHDVDARGLVV